MKHRNTLLGASVLALIVASAGVGHAADMYSSGSFKDPITGAVSSINWDGTYASVGVSAVFGDSKASAPNDGSIDLGLAGARFDGRIGYDRTVLPGWLLGIYGEVGHSKDVSGSVLTSSFGEGWTYGAGIRAGREFGNALIYGLVGYVHQDVSFSGPTDGLAGIKLGGGIEVMMKDVCPHCFVALEGSWSGFEDSKNVSLGSPVTFSNKEEQVGLRFGVKM